MELKIALCGAHRVGKSTLAQEFAKQHKIRYLDMQTSDVTRRLGFNVAKPLNAQDRKNLQAALLHHYTELYRTPGSWVADRSVFDLILYSFMEYPELVDWVDQFAKDCCNIAHYLTHLVYVPATIPVVYQEGKANSSPDAILKADLLIRGCISRFVEDRQDLSLDMRFFRLNSNMNTVEQRVQQLSTMLQLF